MTTNLWNLWHGLNDVEVLTGPPPRLGLPPAKLAGRYDQHLGELIAQYTAALDEHGHAVAAVQSATGPNGAAWHRAIHADRARVASGENLDPGDSAVEALLRGSDRRISTVVIASARVDHMLGQVKARAADPSVQGAIIAASLTWSNEAAELLAEAVQRDSRAALEALRESQKRVWSPLQSLLAWAYDPASDYRQRAYGWPDQINQHLADASVREQLDQLTNPTDPDFGSQNLMLRLPAELISSGGKPIDRPDEGKARRLRNRIAGSR